MNKLATKFYLPSKKLWKSYITLVLTLFSGTILAQCDGQATFTDSRDGNVYNQVTIGSQCWMAENLNFSTSGTFINGTINQTNNGVVEKYCYNNSDAMCTSWGGLYQWGEVMQYSTVSGSQGICPDGWHIPTDAEWCTLENTVQPGADPGCNTFGWRGGELEVGQPHGFEGQRAGYRGSGAAFLTNGTEGIVWSSSETSGSTAMARDWDVATTGSLRYNGAKDMGLSIRCVRNTAPWPLPIELLYFKANWLDQSYKQVILEWETLSESSNSHFEIERSIDAIHFEHVKSVAGVGETNENVDYSTLDNSPYQEGTSYYRLKQIDNNGDFEYSNIEALNIPEGLSFINLFPNPAVNDLNVLLTSSQEDEVTIKVVNNLGQTVREMGEIVEKGYNAIKLNVSEMDAGNYFIEIYTTSGKYKIERKFMKAKE